MRLSFCFMVLLSSLAGAAEKPVSVIGFGSCASTEKPQPIWDAVLAMKPEMFILLGDNVYADTIDPVKMSETYAKLAAVPGFAALRKQCTVLATWDDHDYGVNDGGGDYPMKEAAQRIFLDFFEVPPDSPRRKREGIYDAKIFGPEGKRVQVILLDTRYFRSPLIALDPPERIADPKAPGGFRMKKTGRNKPNPDPAATVLGEAQWKWLEEQLRQPANVRILASSIQLVADSQPWEKWGNFPLEQQRLYKMIRDTKANGIVVLSGDRHRAEISLEPKAAGYPIYDITSSSLTNPSKAENQDEPNDKRVGEHNYLPENYGLLTIDWTQPDPLLRFEIRGLKNEVPLKQDVRLSTLRHAARR
jgi:alkaline phosphatase D